MPVFYFLLVVALIAVWFCASALYKPIGAFLKGIFNDAKDSILSKDEEERS